MQGSAVCLCLSKASRLGKVEHLSVQMALLCEPLGRQCSGGWADVGFNYSVCAITFSLYLFILSSHLHIGTTGSSQPPCGPMSGAACPTPNASSESNVGSSALSLDSLSLRLLSLQLRMPRLLLSGRAERSGDLQRCLAGDQAQVRDVELRGPRQLQGPKARLSSQVESLKERSKVCMKLKVYLKVY